MVNFEIVRDAIKQSKKIEPTNMYVDWRSSDNRTKKIFPVQRLPTPSEIRSITIAQHD